MAPKTLTRKHPCTWLLRGNNCAQVWGPEPSIFSQLPLQILGLIIVRRLLDLVFSQHDLAWIDNILPEKEKKETNKKKKRRKGAHEDSDKEVGRM